MRAHVRRALEALLPRPGPPQLILCSDHQPAFTARLQQPSGVGAQPNVASRRLFLAFRRDPVHSRRPWCADSPRSARPPAHACVAAALGAPPARCACPHPPLSRRCWVVRLAGACPAASPRPRPLTRHRPPPPPPNAEPPALCSQLAFLSAPGRQHLEDARQLQGGGPRARGSAEGAEPAAGAAAPARGGRARAGQPTPPTLLIAAPLRSKVVRGAQGWGYARFVACLQHACRVRRPAPAAGVRRLPGRVWQRCCMPQRPTACERLLPWPAGDGLERLQSILDVASRPAWLKVRRPARSRRQLRPCTRRLAAWRPPCLLTPLFTAPRRVAGDSLPVPRL